MVPACQAARLRLSVRRGAAGRYHRHHAKAPGQEEEPGSGRPGPPRRQEGRAGHGRQAIPEGALRIGPPGSPGSLEEEGSNALTMRERSRILVSWLSRVQRSCGPCDSAGNSCCGPRGRQAGAVGENVKEFPVPPVNATDTRPRKPGSSLGNLVAVQGFEPRTQRI